MIYYVLSEGGPKPRTIEELAHMREVGELPDDALIKQGSGGQWCTFRQLFEEEVEILTPAGRSSPPPLPAGINTAEPESGYATQGFRRHWKWIAIAIVAGGIFLVGEGEWREKRFLELLGGAAMGAVFVGFGLLVKLSSWIESQGGFKKAWGVIFAGKSRRGDSRSVLKKKP